MNAIKIIITGIGEAISLGNFVEYLNKYEDVAATLLSDNTAFVAAAGDGELALVKAVTSKRFYEYEIETIK